ncbi:MAG: TolC family protein [Dysgonamonadaceae bacterium]|nr:TolC family protein [Dysgonamonadaceae bacterium]
MKKRALLIMAAAVSLLPVKAETYNLTLDESIEIAKEKSYRMLTLTQELNIARYNLQSATSRLKTHINMNLSLPSYTETVRQKADSTGVFFSVRELTYSSGLTVNQPLPTDGNIFIQSGLSSFRDYYNGTRSANLSTRLGFRQPIDAFYGYNAIRSTLKSAQLAYEQSNKSLKREELNLVYDVSSSYYNLLSLQKRAEIAQLDLVRQAEAFEISRNKYEAGLIREVDALQMEVDLAEAQSNYDMAVLSHSSSTNQFKSLLGIQLTDSVTLSSRLDYRTIIVDPEKAVQLALANRLEIREREIQIDLQRLEIKRQRAAGMIRGNVEAYFEKVGTASSSTNLDILNSVNNSWNNLTNRPNNYGIGFTLSIPILDWGENRALVRSAKARLGAYTLQKEQVERDIETEVRNLASGINSHLKRLQLLEKNVAVAEKSFEITLQRFSDGDIDSQSLALERNRLNTAYTSHLSAYINYQLALADLMRKTFYDFRNDAVVE